MHVQSCLRYGDTAIKRNHILKNIFPFTFICMCVLPVFMCIRPLEVELVEMTMSYHLGAGTKLGSSIMTK